MQVEVYCFGEFRLDPANRHLSRAGERIELSGRYFDALALLAAEAGQLVTKDRFFEEVWRGVPVTDDALTQCIKELRKALGDNAARPAFIETVPKYGYRFVAAIESGGQGKAAALTTGRSVTHTALQRFLLTGLAGMAGGALAGGLGGLIYGFVAASDSSSGGNALSVFVIIWLLTLTLAALGGAGVGFGIAAARHIAGDSWAIDLAGGALGGMILGGAARLLGHDAFVLLFGAAPDRYTGAFEGLLLGAAAALAARLVRHFRMRRGLLLALVTGTIAGLAVTLSGGQLLAGSLAALSREFPDARLQLEGIGALFGEAGFGPLSQTVTAAAEAGLFCLAVAALLVWADARRRRSKNHRRDDPKALA